MRRTLNGRKIPPMKEVFSSLPFLALIATHTGFNWGFYVLITGTPLFLNNIHHYSITSVSEIALFRNFQTFFTLFFLLSEWIHLHSSLSGHVPHVIPCRNGIRLSAEHRPPLHHSHKKIIQHNGYNWTWIVHDWPRLCGLQQHLGHIYISIINGNECR